MGTAKAVWGKPNELPEVLEKKWSRECELEAWIWKGVYRTETHMGCPALVTPLVPTTLLCSFQCFRRDSLQTKCSPQQFALVWKWHQVLPMKAKTPMCLLIWETSYPPPVKPTCLKGREKKSHIKIMGLPSWQVLAYKMFIFGQVPFIMQCNSQAAMK